MAAASCLLFGIAYWVNALSDHSKRMPMLIGENWSRKKSAAYASVGLGLSMGLYLLGGFVWSAASS